MVTFSIVDNDNQARMRVVGVGGAGGNAVNRMIEAGLRGVDFIAINSDAQDLELSEAPRRVQIGQAVAKGLGAGANPEIGRQAIEEDREPLNGARSNLDSLALCFAAVASAERCASVDEVIEDLAILREE